MNNKNVDSGKRVNILLLSVLTLVSGLLTAILFQAGLLLIAFTSGLLAAIFLIESTGKHRLTIVLPIVLVLFDLIFNGVFSFNCAFSVIVAFIIYRCFIKWREKSECAVYSSIAIIGAIYVSFLMLGFFMIREMNISAVMDFYKAELDLLRTEFINTLSSISIETPDAGMEYLFAKEDLELIFDSTLLSLPSFFGVLAFAISGVALKLFTVLGIKNSVFSDRIDKFSFKCSNTCAYFYTALVILTFFVGTQGAFSLTVSNLYTLFMFVFAYLGYKHIGFVLGKTMGKPRFARLMVLILAIMFSAFAIQLLSYIGVFVTIVSNKSKFLPGEDGNK